MSRLKDLIFAMEESPDVDGVWDYESRIAALVPPAEVDLSGFIQAELSGLDTLWLATALHIFARCGHREVAPFAARLLDDPVVSTRIEAAGALAIAGDARGLEWLEGHARRGRDPDLLEQLEALSEHIPLARLQAIQSLAMGRG